MTSKPITVSLLEKTLPNYTKWREKATICADKARAFEGGYLYLTAACASPNSTVSRGRGMPSVETPKGVLQPCETVGLCGRRSGELTFFLFGRYVHPGAGISSSPYGNRLQREVEIVPISLRPPSYKHNLFPSVGFLKLL